jgi:hypothetical protein
MKDAVRCYGAADAHMHLTQSKTEKSIVRSMVPQNAGLPVKRAGERFCDHWHCFPVSPVFY